MDALLPRISEAEASAPPRTVKTPVNKPGVCRVGMVTVKKSNGFEASRGPRERGAFDKNGESSSTPIPLRLKVKELELMKTMPLVMFSRVPEKVSVWPGTPVWETGERFTFRIGAA